MSRTEAEIRATWPENEGGGWWVFWQTATAYGSRGQNLSKTQAEDLAARIREKGPNA